jgi:hypothetical protein
LAPRADFFESQAIMMFGTLNTPFDYRQMSKGRCHRQMIAWHGHLTQQAAFDRPFSTKRRGNDWRMPQRNRQQKLNCLRLRLRAPTIAPMLAETLRGSADVARQASAKERQMDQATRSWKQIASLFWVCSVSRDGMCR